MCVVCVCFCGFLKSATSLELLVYVLYRSGTTIAVLPSRFYPGKVNMQFAWFQNEKFSQEAMYKEATED